MVNGIPIYINQDLVLELAALMCDLKGSLYLNELYLLKSNSKFTIMAKLNFCRGEQCSPILFYI